MKVKKIIFIFLITFYSNVIISQNIPGVNIQGTAIINNIPIINKQISINVNLYEGLSGQKTFSENHTITTNNIGNFNLIIGSGTAIIGELKKVNFENSNLNIELILNYENVEYTFLKKELDAVPYTHISEKTGKILSMYFYEMLDVDTLNVKNLKVEDSARVLEYRNSKWTVGKKISNFAQIDPQTNKLPQEYYDFNKSNMVYKGVWNAKLNTPKILSNSKSDPLNNGNIITNKIGEFYIVSDSNSNLLIDKDSIWKSGERIISNGSIWEKVPLGITDISDNSINSNYISSGSILTNKIEDNSITSSKIKIATVLGEDIAENAVKSEHILDGTIINDNISNSTILSRSIKDNSISNAIGDREIVSTKIGTGEVKNVDIDFNSITSAQILPSQIQTSHFADYSVTSNKIKDDEITSNKLEVNSIGTSEIVNNALTSSKIENGILSTNDFVPSSILNHNFVDRSITNIDFAVKSIKNNNLKINSITKEKIVNSVVGSEKIANNSIFDSLVENGTIINEDIKENGILGASLVDSCIDSSKVNLSVIKLDKVANNTINGSHLKDTSIITRHIISSAVTSFQLDERMFKSEHIGDFAIHGYGSTDANYTGEKSHICKNEILNNNFANKAFTVEKLEDNMVHSGLIEDGSITTDQIEENISLPNLGVGNAPGTGDILYISTSFKNSPLTIQKNTDGVLVSFIDNSNDPSTEIGNISLASQVVSYNTFTGSHYGYSNQKLNDADLLCFIGKENSNVIKNNKTSEIIYNLEKCNKQNSKTVAGTLFLLMDSIKHNLNNELLFSSVGNGYIKIVETGKNVEIGDYIISSNIDGYGMLLDDTYQKINAIARSNEKVKWEDVNLKLENGKKFKKISIYFTHIEIDQSEKILHNKMELLKKEFAEIKKNKN